jgi:hypothetical protein
LGGGPPGSGGTLGQNKPRGVVLFFFFLGRGTRGV